MHKFPPIDPDAIDVLVFDFTPSLQNSEVLMGGPVLQGIVCTNGVDTNALSMVLGPPSYDVTGRKVLIPVGNLSARVGNDYAFEVISATTFEPREIVARALLEVRIGE